MTNANKPGSADDPYNLSRFVEAQEEDYEQALAEIVSGRRPEIDFAFTGLPSDRPKSGATTTATAARLRLP